MNRARYFFILASAWIAVIALDVFFSGLTPPIHSVEIAAIVIFLTYLFSPLDRAIIAALVIGALQDFALMRFMGAASASYTLAIALLYISRKTIITRENLATVLLSGGIFFSVAEGLEFARIWNVSYTIILEMFFRIAVNSALAGIGYIMIRKIQKEVHKRFI
ncbi:MAG: hypothetical protein HY564_03065 [Candidatus Jacksonbacteria bacterium]|nr:hypothetical protein [Candidatus Jacksonbacteria bacterium]